MNEFIPFATPDITDLEINEVVDCLKKGWLTTGPKTRQFEKDFADFIGSDVSALGVNSATSGLHLALEALGIKEGDEVIVPTYTFTATAEVVRYLGAKPVLVDIDPISYNISIDAFKKAITAKTKAVIPVHFAGLSCDMDEIISIAKTKHIKVVEDAAHALPASYKGELIGNLDTDATVFSFYANKTMTTAEGGMLVSKNQELIERAKVMRLHGINRDAFDRYTSSKPSWYYEVIEAGFKYNMTDLSAAIGMHQLKRLPSFLQKRQEISQYYFDNLSHLPIALPPIPKSSKDIHAWHLFPILLDAKISREDFINKMYAQKIACSVHFIPLHKHPVWKRLSCSKMDSFPVADSIFDREVSIPLYTKMSKDMVQRVSKTIKQIIEELY